MFSLAGNIMVLITITFTPGRGDPLAISTLSASCFIQNLKTVRLRMPCSLEQLSDNKENPTMRTNPKYATFYLGIKLYNQPKDGSFMVGFKC